MSVRQFLAAVVLLFSAQLPGQELDVVPHFKAGDTFRVEVIHILEGSAQTPAKIETRTPHAVRVIEARADGFLLDWSAGTTEYPDPALATDRTIAALSKVAAGLHLLIKLGPGGDFRGLQNEEEATKKLQQSVDAALKAVLAQASQAQRREYETTLRKTMTPSVLINNSAHEISYYLGMYGVRMPLGKPIEAILPSADGLSGTTVPTKIRSVLEKVDEKTAQLSFGLSYDAKALRTITDQIESASGARSGTLPLIELSEQGKYIYSRASGLMKEVVYTRRSVVGKQTRKEEWTMRLIGPQ